MVFFRFGTKAGDHIGGYAATGDQFPDTVNFCNVPLPAVGTVHHLKYPAAAALNRKMDVVADIFVLQHRQQNIVCNVFGM